MPRKVTRKFGGVEWRTIERSSAQVPQWESAVGGFYMFRTQIPALEPWEIYDSKSMNKLICIGMTAESASKNLIRVALERLAAAPSADEEGKG